MHACICYTVYMKKKQVLTEKELSSLSKQQLIELTLSLQTKLNDTVDDYNALCKRFFSSKSEKVHPGQMSLFNEAELVEDTSSEEEKKEPVLEVSKKKKKSARNSRLRNVEVDEEHITREDIVCPECGKKMQEIKPKVIEYLTYKPAKWIMKRYIVHQYTCHECNDKNLDMKVYEGDTSKLPARLIDGSFVTASVVANIACNKFLLGLPYYRQEKDLKSRGLPFSRQNLCRWVLKSSELYLQSVYDRMHKDLLECGHLNMDETELTCLEEADNKTNYIWAAMSGQYEENQMALYFYSANRKYNNVNRILGDHYEGVIQSDGYQAYDKYTGTDQKAGCWAHARRRVYEAASTNGDLFKRLGNMSTKEAKETLFKENPSFASQMKLLAKINLLFENEQRYKDMTAEERLAHRKEDDESILSDIKTLVDEMTNSFLPSGKTGKALTYITNQWEPLTYFMKDGQVPLSNNITEREAIKPVVISRKNFLFADTISGAENSMAWFSLLISAKLNHLNPEKYAVYVLEQLSTYGLHDDVIERILPYSKNLPAELKAAACL